MLPSLNAQASLRAPSLSFGGRPGQARGALQPAVNAACLESCAPGRADACHAQCSGDLACWAQCAGSQGVANCVAPCYQSAS